MQMMIKSKDMPGLQALEQNLMALKQAAAPAPVPAVTGVADLLDLF